MRAYKSARKGSYDDRHHVHMARHYKETPWRWYVAVLVFSFVLGLVVVIKENITLPAWAYIVSLLLGIFIAPFVSMPTYNICPQSELSDATVERHSLFSLWQWYCYEQLVENASWSGTPWTPRW
jgi:cytochrome bd-type quinol oxidase subunit 2